MSAKKTPRKTSPRPNRPSNGGLLRTGNPGNAGGSGRPPSLIREQLRGTIAERAALLESIMDGEPMQRASFPLAAVLAHAHCPNCNERLKPNDVSELVTVEIQGKISASPKDRISAYDTAAKYGLGTLKEVSVENVRERVAATLTVIRNHCSATQANTLIDALRPVWA